MLEIGGVLTAFVGAVLCSKVFTTPDTSARIVNTGSSLQGDALGTLDFGSLGATACAIQHA